MSNCPKAVSTAVGRALLVGLLLPIGCNGDPAARPSAVTHSATSGEPREGFLGAAHLIPADAGYFSSLVGVGALLDELGNAAAMRALLDLPMVRMAGMQLLGSPLAYELARARRRSPLLDQGIDVVLDGVGTEAFLWVGAEAADFGRALRSVYGAAMLGELRTALGAHDHEKGARLIASVLEHREALRLPPITLGLRLAAPERGRRFVNQLAIAAERDLPFALERMSSGGGEYFAVRITPAEVPGWARTVTQGLRGLAIPPRMADRFLEFIGSQTLVVAVGLREDCLLVSIGESADHLATLGSGPSLAESVELEPLRRRIHTDLLSLTYVSPDMHLGSKLPVDEIVALLANALPAAPAVESSPGVFDRLQRDLRVLLEEINTAIPDPGSYLSATVLNDGLESFTIESAAPTAHADQPLTILRQAGSAPLVVAARRSPGVAHAYDRLGHWVRVAWRYFEELAVPSMSAADREAFDKFKLTCVPLLQDLDATTAEQLLPAVDGCQAMFTMDGEGELPFMPGIPGRVSPPVRCPRPALVWEVRDREKLIAAFTQYRGALNRFFDRLRAVYDLDDVPRVPSPEMQSHAGGTMYWYPMIGPQPPELVLHAVLTDDTAVLALWPQHSAEVLRESWEPPGDTVDLDAPASAAWWLDLRGLGSLVTDDARTLVDHLTTHRMMSRQDHSMTVLHLNGLARAIDALGALSGRVHTENGHTVRQTWLQLQDR